MATSFGNYQLVRKLASGGMGEVFLARGEGGEPVVIKRLLPHLSRNPEFLDLFLEEARVASQLTHPNVVRIFELGDVGGAWYLLEEYVAGRDLRQVLEALRRRRRKLPLGLACRIAAEAAAGLDYAHHARDAQGRPLGIVHRDVSPHNLLLSFDGAVKLIDFGVARAAGRLQQTWAGALPGKYPYMSPEQASEGELDHRSDQFSLGVILWELLAGQRLFKAANDAQTLQRVAQCGVRAPARRGEVLPPALIGVVMRALGKDPGSRFADLGEFRGALEEVLIGQGWDAGPMQLAELVRRLFPGGGEEGGTEEGPSDSRPGTDSGTGSGSGPVSAPELAWKVLREHEQLALAQLSVFDGEFSIEAAEAVVSLVSFPEAPWALDVLEALRERAMVRAANAIDAPGELRFGLVENMRELAARKLEAFGPGVAQDARQRLAGWLGSGRR